MLERDLRVDHFSLCQRNSEMIKVIQILMCDIQTEIELDRIQTSEFLVLLLQVLEMSDPIDLSVDIMVKDIREVID